MIPTTYGMTLSKGIPHVVTVQTTTTRGIPKLIITGRAAQTLLEAKTRISTALLNQGIRLPRKKIVVDLSPHDLPKSDSALDFALTISLLSYQHLTSNLEPSTVFIGSVALDGSIVATPGLLTLALRAKAAGFTAVCVPLSVAAEVYRSTRLKVYACTHIREYINNAIKPYAQNNLAKKTEKILPADTIPPLYTCIRGQLLPKRAVAIAVAGKHNLLFIGPPGEGKTLLSQAAAQLQPELTEPEYLALQELRSRYTPTIDTRNSLERPFIAPHHSVSRSELFHSPRTYLPGALAQAHGGILFLDELPEFSKPVLAALRQPLEEKHYTTGPTAQTVHCDCITIAAMNPCPCGFSESPEKACSCTLQQKNAYARRVSPPLKERFDLTVKVFPSTSQELETKPDPARLTTFLDLKKTIARVRAHPAIDSRAIQLPYDTAAQRLLNKAHTKLNLSARVYYSCQRVAQTIALLEEEETILADHVAEALHFRMHD